MPTITSAALRKHLASGKADPVYLLIGDDEPEMAALTEAFGALVEEDLRAFNVERFHGTDKSTTPAAVTAAARVLPMMAPRRIVLLLRAERFLNPKKRGAGDGAEDGEEADVLADYVGRPEPLTTLVISGSELNKTRRLVKTLYKQATVVECWGLKGVASDPRNVRSWELDRIAREAEAVVRRLVADAGRSIQPAAVRLLATRAGTDIGRLRGDVERLLLYAPADRPIVLDDAQQVVSGETSQDAWAVTNALAEGNCAEALRQLGLALEAGAVSYMVLGQLGWFVREKLAAVDARRVPAAIEALFRTDLELKTSAGDPRILLERLVVELCRSKPLREQRTQR